MAGGPTVYVYTEGGRVPVPAGTRKDGFILEWAHVAENAAYMAGPSSNPYLQKGYLVIERISEYLSGSGSLSATSPDYYAAGISGGSDIGRRQQFHVEVRTGGKKLRRFPAELINFESAGPGHLWQASLIMPLGKVVYPHPGKYEFTAFIGGKPIGSIDFWVSP